MSNEVSKQREKNARKSDREEEQNDWYNREELLVQRVLRACATSDSQSVIQTTQDVSKVSANRTAVELLPERQPIILLVVVRGAPARE
jgi:precorrin isomerase